MGQSTDDSNRETSKVTGQNDKFGGSVEWEQDQKNGQSPILSTTEIPQHPPSPPEQSPADDGEDSSDDDVLAPLEYEERVFPKNLYADPDKLTEENNELIDQQRKIQERIDERMLDVISKSLEVRIRKHLLEKLRSIGDQELEEESDLLEAEKKALEEKKSALSEMRSERDSILQQKKELKEELIALDKEKTVLDDMEAQRSEMKRIQDSLKSERDFLASKKEEHEQLRDNISRSNQELESLMEERKKVVGEFNVERAQHQLGEAKSLLDYADMLDMDTAQARTIYQDAIKSLDDGDPETAYGLARDCTEEIKGDMENHTTHVISEMEKEITEIKNSGEDIHRAEVLHEMIKPAFDGGRYELLSKVIKETRLFIDQANDVLKTRESIERVQNEISKSQKAYQDRQSELEDMTGRLNELKDELTRHNEKCDAQEKEKQSIQDEIDKITSQNKIEIAKMTVKSAAELGADLSLAKEQLSSAEICLKKKEHEKTREYANRCISTVENVRYETVVSAIEDVKEELKKARSSGVRVELAEEIFTQIQPRFEKKQDEAVISLVKLTKEAMDVALNDNETHQTMDRLRSDLDKLTGKLDDQKEKLRGHEKTIAQMQNKVETAQSEMDENEKELLQRAKDVKSAEADSVVKLLELKLRSAEKMGIDTGSIKKASIDIGNMMKEGKTEEASRKVKEAVDDLTRSIQTHVEEIIKQAQDTVTDSEGMGVDVSRASSILGMAKKSFKENEFAGALVLARLAKESSQVSEQLFMVNKLWDSTRSQIEKERKGVEEDRAQIHSRKEDIKRMREGGGASSPDEMIGSDDPDMGHDVSELDNGRDHENSSNGKVNMEQSHKGRIIQDRTSDEKSKVKDDKGSMDGSKDDQGRDHIQDQASKSEKTEKSTGKNIRQRENEEKALFDDIPDGNVGEKNKENPKKGDRIKSSSKVNGEKRVVDPDGDGSTPISTTKNVMLRDAFKDNLERLEKQKNTPDTSERKRKKKSKR